MALTIPAVTVKVKFSPSGLPIASTHSPMRTESEFPNCAVGSPLVSILMTATSVLGSVPTTRAVNSRLSYSFTVNRTTSTGPIAAGSSVAFTRGR